MTCPKCGAYILDEPHSRESQNLFHAIVRRLAPEMGQTFEQTKLQIKCEVVTPLLYDDFLDIVKEKGPPKYRGSWHDMHDIYEQYVEDTYAYIKSEADYTKNQDAQAISIAIQWAAEIGVYVEDLLGETNRATESGSCGRQSF
jgi:hypothetical protein